MGRKTDQPNVQETSQMTELAVKDIKIVTTKSHRFRKLEEKINVQSRNMEDNKRWPKLKF